MLNDKSVRVLVDYHKASDCFPNVEIKGGVNYSKLKFDDYPIHRLMEKMVESIDL